jgi:ribosomal protein L16 Arg81 hydroxylase
MKREPISPAQYAKANWRMEAPELQNVTSETEANLAFLLYPRTETEFLTEAWQKGPYLIKRGRPDYFADIFGIRDLDTLISLSANLSPKHLRLVRTEGTKLNEQPVESHPDGTVDIYSTYRAYSDGFSVVANSMDTRWLPIARLCRNIEKNLQHRVLANLYATPAGAQGFTPHYDTHDVLVLQITGAKQWKIYRPLINMPMEDSNVGIEPSHLAEPYRVLVMEAGDLLYLPRGWVHEASTSEMSSIHLTLGIHVTKWLDILMDAVAMAAAEDEDLRATFPFKALTDGMPTAEVAVRLHELLGRISARLPVNAAIDARSRRSTTGADPAPDGHFADLDRLAEVNLETRLCVRPGIISRVSLHGEEAGIQFRGNLVRGPLKIAPALRYIAATAVFKPANLPDLDDTDRLILAKRLVVEGLLSID